MNELPDPFGKDSLESSDKVKKNILSEKDFIQESPTPPQRSGSFPLWLWIALAAFTVAILSGSLGWFQKVAVEEIKSKPFLEVTNRQFSVFLWQFPAFMRSYAKQKASYLPGFQHGESVTLDVSAAENFVSAPPELLFLYHTWDRLISSVYIDRPISPSEFIEFLNQVPEWQPLYWKDAPEEYKTLISSNKYTEIKDLQTLPESALPHIVRQVFEGWKNYFKEGPAINEMTVNFKQLKDFLDRNPLYARNYWKNIQFIEDKEVAGSQYLESLLTKKYEPDEKFPSDQLAPFLRVALFNTEQAQKKE